VDDLVDALTEYAAGGGITALPILARFPWIAALVGGTAALCGWWAGHLNRVRRAAGCGQGQTAGVKICIYLATFPTASAYCYPPKC
jgi:hypothetical protein